MSWDQVKDKVWVVIHQRKQSGIKDQILNDLCNYVDYATWVHFRHVMNPLWSYLEREKAGRNRR